jgi:hypothetical protein
MPHHRPQAAALIKGELAVKEMFQHLEQMLSGWPDTILSASLVVSGIVVIGVGLFAPRTIKLLVLAWVWFP